MLDPTPCRVSLLSEDILLPGPNRVKRRNFAIHHVARTGSTQEMARRAAEQGVPDGYCCVADEQTQGRGRQGRSWTAPRGTALLTSVLLRLEATPLAGLPFAAGLAVADALRDLTGLTAGLKWPNDVLVDGRKLAGLLVEILPGVPLATTAHGTTAVVGLGLNLSVPSFAPEVSGVSLHELVRTVPARDEMLRAWLSRLDERVAQLEREGMESILGDWRHAAVMLGSTVVVAVGGNEVTGVAEDVAPDGALVLRMHDGSTQRVLAADVHILPERTHTA